MYIYIYKINLWDSVIVGFCKCSMFCYICTLLCVHFSCAIISMGKRGLVALLCLSFWCLVINVWLFLTMPRACLQFVIMVFPDHTHLQFLIWKSQQPQKSLKMSSMQRIKGLDNCVTLLWKFQKCQLFIKFSCIFATMRFQIVQLSSEEWTKSGMY